MNEFRILRAVREIRTAVEVLGSAASTTLNSATLRGLAETENWTRARLGTDVEQPRYSMHSVLLAVLKLRENLEPKLVVTLPVETGDSKTKRVVHELLTAAKDSLLVFSFAMSVEFQGRLVAAAQNGVSVDIVVCSSRPADWAILSHESNNNPRLRVWSVVGGEARYMHAKVIIADRGRGLLGSANFSESGLGADGPTAERNWEMGIQFGKPEAARIWRNFERLRDRQFLRVA